jgi:hypothetical protein
MAAETVTIGCKSPAGFILEIGYTIGPAGGQVLGDNYQRVVIYGWNRHTQPQRIALKEAGSTGDVPHGTNTSPYLNRNVPKAFWEQWVKEHPKSWLLKNEILFAVASGDHAGAALRQKEGEKTPKILTPLDRNKSTIPGVTPVPKDDQAA